MATKSRVQLTVQFGEHEEGNYHICDTCGSRTMLIYPEGEWSVDMEPFREGEEADENVPASVDVPDEVSAHYCPTCERINSLSFNAAAPTTDVESAKSADQGFSASGQ